MRKNLICLVLILIMLCLTKLQAEEFLPSDSAEEKQAEIDKDIEALKRKAQAEIAKEETAGEKPEEKVFRSGGLSLQALNPEISVTGEMIGYYNQQDGTRKHSEFNYRGLGLHFESYLDPYSKFKAAVPVNKNIATLGEAYFTRFGLFKNVNLTLGKFRQQFGVVNRWHKHGLDQVDFPLPLRMIFGNGGLNQIGISADWIMPKTNNFSQELTVQMTNGENGRLFEGNTLGRLSFLAHYKNYRDITKDTYLEFGLTGLLGWNDEWEIFPGPIKEHERHHVFVAGVDFTLLWEPTERMRYRNLVWRTEAYFLNKNILAPDGSGKDCLKAWGAYSYLETKVTRTCNIGIKADYYQPDTKPYAALSQEPLAVTKDNAYSWQLGPYVTWYQSPWVKYRLEYNYVENDHMGISEDEKTVMFQVVFAAGPHKHERY